MEEDIKYTDVWLKYEKAKEYCRLKGLFNDVDINNDFYNGAQWKNLKVPNSIEKVTLNFIKPIVNYKIGVLLSNYRAINYNLNYYKNDGFVETGKEVCDMLNFHVAKLWENDKMDIKLKKVIKKSGIAGEGIIYSYYENKEIKNKLLNMTDVFYSDENNENIEEQDYILVKERMPLPIVKKIAKDNKISKAQIERIVGDTDKEEQAGSHSKEEKENKTTVITIFWKENGELCYSKVLKEIVLIKPTKTGYSRYPIAHLNWEEQEGSARGVGEVKYLIHNQMEVNKTLLRRLVTARNVAYPQIVYNSTLVQNPEEIGNAGAKIAIHDMNASDVRSAFNITNTGTISSDVEKLQNELINVTRELANASMYASGQINPEQASGRAILAVQQASQQPLNEQSIAINNFIEDLAKIWFDFWKVNGSNEGMKLIIKNVDPLTGKVIFQEKEVPRSVFEKLETSVKIDVTPKGAYDKFAQEMSLENLAKTPLFMNTAWLEDYVSMLDNDSVMPKLKLEELIKRRKAKEEEIRKMQINASNLQNNINGLISEGMIVPSDQNIMS